MGRLLITVLLSWAFGACGGAPIPSGDSKPRVVVVTSPPCATRDRLTRIAVELAQKAETSPEDRSLDRPIISAALQSVLHERQHHGNDLTISRKGYFALKPALERVVEKTASCEVAVAAGRVSALDGDAALALAIFAKKGRSCRTPNDDASVCLNASRPLSEEHAASAKAQVQEAWPHANQGQRMRFLRAVQACTRRPDLARELDFAGAEVRDAFLAHLAREDAEDQRRITRQLDIEFARRDMRSKCESSCISLYGESAARTGPNATLCDFVCGSDTSCRKACATAGNSCFAHCGSGR